MPNYNRLTIIGHLGRAPEAKATNSGATMTTFPVAVTEYTKKKDGEGFDEKTVWFDCTCWDKYLAEKITRSNVQKGAPVMIVGPVSARAFAGSDGSPKAGLSVIVKEFTNLTTKAQQGGTQTTSYGPGNNPYSAANKAPQQNTAGGNLYDAPMPEEDDGLPF